jgi:putative membrane protein
MKKILQIFISDARGIFKNKITFFLICGLLILPSFYAWFNIYASWDPYGNTSAIKVAVCNKDLGATLLGQDVNIGEELIENLKEENTLGWFFIDNEEEAIKFTRIGEAYASIVIPSDFSAKMVTVLDENPMKPSLEYYVNEKINPIVPKITDKGVSTLQTEIGNAFIESFTEEIFSTLETLGLTTEEITEKFDSYKKYLDDFIEDMPIIINRLGATADTVESGSSLIALSAGDVGLVSDILDDSISFTKDIKTDVDKINNDADKSLKDFSETLELAKISLEDLDNNVLDLKEKIILDKPGIIDILRGSSADLKTITMNIRVIQISLDEFDNEIFTQIDALDTTIDNQLNKLENLIDDLDNLNNVDLNNNKISDVIISIISLNNNIISSFLSLSDQLEVVDSSYDILNITAKTAKEDIDVVVNKIKIINTKYSDIFDSINKLHEFVVDVDQYISFLQKDFGEIRGYIDTINKLSKDEKDYLTPFFSNIIDTILIRLDDIYVELNDLAEEIDDKDNTEVTLDNIHNLNLNIISSLNSLIDDIDTDLTISSKKYLSGISDFSSNLTLLLASINKRTPLVEDFLYKIANSGKDTADDMMKLSKELPELQEDLTKVSGRLDEFDEKIDIERFSDILISNKNIVSDFMANPVDLNTHALYSVEYYGISMTPFYITLSLWVGILVLAGLLTTKSKNVGFKPTPLENYLGKYPFFVMLAVIQGLIVSLGSLLLLNVSAAEPVLFVVLTMFQSFVFCTIIYTLISLFGNIGKALGVVFLVLQVAGAGGTFPIQMNPIFFQRLYEWLPFTYGIGALREAIFGVFYPVLIKDVGMLIIYFIIFLVIGVLFVSKNHKHVEKLAEKFEESGLSE